jgi:hypothetical protein
LRPISSVKAGREDASNVGRSADYADRDEVRAEVAEVAVINVSTLAVSSAER